MSWRPLNGSICAARSGATCRRPGSRRSICATAPTSEATWKSASKEGRSVERAPGARIDGEVRISPRPSGREHYLEHYRSWRFYAGHLAWFAAAFVFGLVAHRLAPVVFRGTVATGSDLLRTLVTGFVMLIVMPVAMIARALTIIGIPIAVAALFLYILAIYTADLVVGAWLGRLLAPPADESMLEFGKSFALSLAMLTIGSLIPFLGPPVGFVALLLGLGLLSARGREALSDHSLVR